MSKTIRAMLGVAVVLALAAAACGGAGAGATGGAPDVSGLDVLKAQSTIDAWNAIQGTAQAEALAATRRAEEATIASVLQTADAAVQATAVAQATWDAIAVNKADAEARQTAAAADLALVVQSTATVRAADATATHDASVMAFMQREADIALRELEADAAAAETWDRLTPWIVGGAALTAMALVCLVVGGWVLVLVRRSQPQQMGALGFTVWGPDGPMAITTPTPRALLTATATPPLDVTPAAVEPEVFRPSERGHVLVAGPTDSGKSTALRTILNTRKNVVVLDPHWDGIDWGESQVIGGARKFEDIRNYMEWMAQELQTRYQARLDGQQTFEPHTVAVDEMPAIVSELGRGIAATWRQWLREGRKVELFLVVSTQSTRVETLGIKGEGDLLNNFNASLVLGKTAVEEYRDLVAGMARPAVLHTVAGARPVIIPNLQPAHRDASPVIVAPPQSTLPPVYATTEWPTRREEAPIHLDNLTERDKQRIADEYYRTLVIAQVQAKLFPDYGSDGGKAGRVIRLVLEEKGLLERGVDDRGRPTWRPTARALGLNAPDRQPTAYA